MRTNFKRSLRRVAAAGLAVAAIVSISGTGPADAAARKGDGKFHVYGINVVGPDGNPMVLRGVNMGGLEYTSTGYQQEYWNYQRMKSWGVNIVRVALADKFALKSMCTYDKKYIQLVDKIVAWGEQLKMLILLDDHTATKGMTCGRGGWSTNQKMPDVQNQEFVKQLATRYKNKPYVAIDLYNEPHYVSYDIWRNGGIVDGYRAIGMQQLLTTVRNTGFKGLVVATGAEWGNDLRNVANQPLQNDGNVIYGAHEYPYTCGGSVPYETPYNCQGKQYSPFLDSQVAPAIGKRPVMLTEFGTQRPIDSEMRAAVQWAEDHHIGWMAWMWCYGTTSDYCLLNKDGSNTPSITGKPVQDALFKANGWKSLNGK